MVLSPGGGIPELITEYAQGRLTVGGFPSADLIHSCSAIPTKYLRMHYYPQQILSEQRLLRTSRAEILQQIGADCFHVYETGDRTAILAALRRRPSQWYEHAVGPT